MQKGVREREKEIEGADELMHKNTASNQCTAWSGMRQQYIHVSTEGQKEASVHSPSRPVPAACSSDGASGRAAPVPTVGRAGLKDTSHVGPRGEGTAADPCPFTAAGAAASLRLERRLTGP